MNLPDPWRGDEMVLKTVLDAMRKGYGQPPVVQHIVRECLSFEDRPDLALEAVSSDHLVYELPLEQDGLVRPRPVGVHIADSAADELHRGFIPALAELVGFFRYRPRSPGRAEPVVAKARDLPFASRLSDAQLRVVGHLLDVESIGRISWADNPASPWEIELGLDVLRYRRVVVLADFVRIKAEGHGAEPFRS